MFEPIHGSAFDIAGKGIANPIGTFWSATLMLEHLGEAAAAARLMRAIERVTADPALHTPDLGGSATTRQVTEAVIEAIEGITREAPAQRMNSSRCLPNPQVPTKLPSWDHPYQVSTRVRQEVGQVAIARPRPPRLSPRRSTSSLPTTRGAVRSHRSAIGLGSVRRAPGWPWCTLNSISLYILTMGLAHGLG